MNAVVLGRVDRARGRELAAISEALRIKMRLFVDVQMVRGMVAFDTYAGWADVVQRGWRGEPVMLGGKIQTKRLIGMIRVVVRDATARELGDLVRHGLLVA